MKTPAVGYLENRSQTTKFKLVIFFISAYLSGYCTNFLFISIVNQKQSNSSLKLPDFQGLANHCEQIFSFNTSEKLVNESISIPDHSFNLRYEENGAFPACEDYFVQREGFLYRGAISDLEMSVPVAFSLMVYHNFDQVELLLLAFYREHNFYCLHVDKSAESDF